MTGPLSYILTGILSKARFGKQLGAREMTIFESHVGSHIPYIGVLLWIKDILTYMVSWPLEPPHTGGCAQILSQE